MLIVISTWIYTEINIRKYLCTSHHIVLPIKEIKLVYSTNLSYTSNGHFNIQLTKYKDIVKLWICLYCCVNKKYSSPLHNISFWWTHFKCIKTIFLWWRIFWYVGEILFLVKNIWWNLFLVKFVFWWKIFWWKII